MPGTEGVILVNPQEDRRRGYSDSVLKRTYWTPDGRRVEAIPQMHGTSSGDVRDANLDRGWTLNPPVNLKPHCPYCDQWHDTEEQIAQCGSERAKKTAEMQKKVAEQFKSADTAKIENLKNEVSSLKSDIGNIKEMLLKLTEGK